MNLYEQVVESRGFPRKLTNIEGSPKNTGMKND